MRRQRDALEMDRDQQLAPTHRSEEASALQVIWHGPRLAVCHAGSCAMPQSQNAPLACAYVPGFQKGTRKKKRKMLRHARNKKTRRKMLRNARRTKTKKKRTTKNNMKMLRNARNKKKKEKAKKRTRKKKKSEQVSLPRRSPSEELRRQLHPRRAHLRPRWRLRRMRVRVRVRVCMCVSMSHTLSFQK